MFLQPAMFSYTGVYYDLTGMGKMATPKGYPRYKKNDKRYMDPKAERKSWWRKHLLPGSLR